MQVTAGEVLDAQRRLEGRVRRTPIVADPVLTERHGAPVRLKLECWQETGSFKLRGAMNRVLQLEASERANGLIAVSAGNHAFAVALASASLGLDLLAVMPSHAPQVKVDGVRRLGAQVVLRGETYDEADVAAKELQAQTGRTFVHPFEDPAVIAGQGTVGLEMALQEPLPDVVLVPAGGGGLVVGVAVAIKALSPSTRVYGVQSEASAPFVAAAKAGHHVPVTFSASLADGLHGDTTPTMVDLALGVVDGFLAVSEAAIRRAVRHLFLAHRLVVEGSGAVGVAALMEGVAPAGSTTAILSGGNIDPATFLEVVGTV